MADPKSKSTVPPTGPAREGVDPIQQEKQDAARKPAPNPVELQPATTRQSDVLDPANIPNVTMSGTGGGGAPLAPPPVQGANLKGSKMVIQMLVPYASAQTVLHAGKAYTVSEEFARQLLETDPPSATTVISEPNRRALRPPAPDPEDKGHD